MRAPTATLALLCVSLAATPLARAAAPKPAEVAAARELAKEGIKLANANKCAEAIDKLSRAEALFHAPTILGRLGECQVAVGKLVAGTENLRKVVLEDLGPRPSQAFLAAKERAKKVLAAAEPRLSRLTLKVNGPAPEAAKVTFDGEALASSVLGIATPVDPGSHKIAAAAEGFLPKDAEITLAEGKAETLELTLEAAPVAIAPKPEEKPAPEPVAVVKAPPPEPPSRVPVWATLGVGVAGLAAGTGFGVAALLNKSALEKACTNKECPASSQGDIDALNLNGNLATVGFAVGAAGLATALVLYVVTGRETPQEKPVTFLVGPNHVALSVRF